METVPPPDPAAEPAGFVVEVAPGDRIHFLDWGGEGRGGEPGVLLIHGLSNTAWSWAPVARRVRAVRRVVAMDLRGHGLSDAPTEGYDPAGFAADVLAAAEGSGLLAEPRDAGRPGRARVRGDRGGLGGGRAGRSLRRPRPGRRRLGVDRGGERDGRRRVPAGLDEPPEVMRSMAAFLADRAGFDPASWDADQERAARATVVETHAGRVVPSTRPHALEACVRAMFGYDPLATLAAIAAPVVALIAGDDDGGDPVRALADGSAARVAAGRDPIGVVRGRAPRATT